MAINGITATAAWTATQTKATGVRVTDDLIFPEKGIWLFIVTFPIVSGTGILSAIGSNIRALSDPNYFEIQNLGRQCIIYNVLADNTSIYLSTSSSAEVNYTALERGYISAVKIK